MANIIIVLFVLAVIALGLKSSVKHFRGEGACCGGGSGELPPEKKELEGPVIGQLKFRISGMHCQHCVNRVTEAINRIDGASAKVSLKKKEAIVSYDKAIDESEVRRAVENAGYEASLKEA